MGYELSKIRNDAVQRQIDTLKARASALRDDTTELEVLYEMLDKTSGAFDRMSTVAGFILGIPTNKVTVGLKLLAKTTKVATIPIKSEIEENKHELNKITNTEYTLKTEMEESSNSQTNYFESVVKLLKRWIDSPEQDNLESIEPSKNSSDKNGRTQKFDRFSEDFNPFV